MSALSDIISAARLAAQCRQQTALATVVQVEGSSYRQPGARMLVTDKGDLTGAISGGCLEGDALRKAQWAMQKGQNQLVIYDTTGDDAGVLGAGLGCEGIIHVLIEPLTTGLLELLAAADHPKKAAVLVTMYHPEQRTGPQPGTIGYYDPESDQWVFLAESEILPDLKSGLEQVLETRHSAFWPLNYATFFLHYIPQALHLVIAGTGIDVLPLMQLAEQQGWTVTLLDERAQNRRPGYLPAGCPVLSGTPAQLLSRVEWTLHTAVVLMTHNYAHDKALLRLLLERPLAYVGMLGPRKKYEKMLADWAEEGFLPTDRQRKNIYAPVGLDIGAETPEAIALSIVAEITAVVNQREGQSLKFRTAPIHQNN